MRRRKQSPVQPPRKARGLVPVLILTSSLVCGCAALVGGGLDPGDPAEKVRAVYGAPQRVWPEASGAASWEYAHGPYGAYTYMVRLDREGRVRTVDQVLQPAVFARLNIGDSREDVERLLGRPARRMTLGISSQDLWAWRYLDGSEPMCFYAQFDTKGALVSTGAMLESQRLEFPFRFC